MIPAEAVEAATCALREAFDMGVDGFEEQARAALEAAAPHMVAGLATSDVSNLEQLFTAYGIGHVDSHVLAEALIQIGYRRVTL